MLDDWERILFFRERSTVLLICLRLNMIFGPPFFPGTFLVPVLYPTCFTPMGDPHPPILKFVFINHPPFFSGYTTPFVHDLIFLASGFPSVQCLPLAPCTMIIRCRAQPLPSFLHLLFLFSPRRIASPAFLL